ncbi:MAG: hypothetical protein WCY93_10690 [Anaerolineaceae bacterium]
MTKLISAADAHHIAAVDARDRHIERISDLIRKEAQEGRFFLDVPEEYSTIRCMGNGVKKADFAIPTLKGFFEECGFEIVYEKYEMSYDHSMPKVVIRW